MGGGSWVVHEGFLLVQRAEVASPRAMGGRGLRELYVVLTMNRKLEFFDGSDADTRARVDAAYLLGFAGWDGDGLLKADAYGLEIKVERHAKPRMHLAAFNRVDQEKWCRGFMAVLDPHSAAGEEVRRERRRVKKEEKRLQEEREEKIRKWKEKKARMLKEEQDRLLAREEEINNMTPLERVDGLGSLDDDTARMLEKRKLRLQRRQAPTMGRVNKAAVRAFMRSGGHEVRSGGLICICGVCCVVFEVGGVVNNDTPVRFGSSGSDLSDSSSMSSRLSSISSVTGSRHDSGMGNGAPPPPPPPPMRSSSSFRISSSSRASMGIPPPPPPPLFDHMSFNERESRLSRSSSNLRSSSFDSFAFDRDEDPVLSRSSFTQGSRRISSADKSKQNMQDNLAAILGGGRPKSASRASRTSHRRDSFGSTMSSVTTASYAVPDRKPKINIPRSNGSNSPQAPEPSMANAFAASLAAIRRNRADTVEEISVGDSTVSPVASVPLNGKVRDRKRDSQLSAEGKEILKKAMGGDSALVSASKPTAKANAGRKGLFDDSSSDEDEDSDTGLFGVGGRKSKAANGAPRPSNSMRSSDLSVDLRPTPLKKNAPAPSGSSNEDVSSDSDSDDGNSLFAQPRKNEPTSPKAVTTNNIGAGGAGPKVVVLFTSSALRTEGKKSTGVFTFMLQFGNLEHSFSFTYSEFEEIHSRLVSAFPGTPLPKFPSKHRLRNNTKPENMEKRAQEFRLYLQQLVALPGVLSSERFQFEYHIDGAFARALVNGQSFNGSTANGSQSNGRPPRSPVVHLPKKEQVASPSSSRQESPPARAKPRASKGLFGLDSDSDPESDSDTSIDTPKPVARQQRRGSTASTTQRRKPKSELSSSVISSVPDNTQHGKKSRSRSRLSSRASSRVSLAAPPPPAEPKPAVTGLPPGRPNPFAGGRGDLLAAIRQGAQLKKTSSIDPAGDSTSGGSLAVEKPPPPPPALTQPGSINEAITNAMAMRRIHVEYEETNSGDDSDSDDDWD
ncbi:unnamed protein product [Phytophthora fragariaefolia]|uniref:Unnamed protein product n=1 Tax=Phytophthora fragariaefolia TaxID=1490495 RepID=A0A9W6TJF8_9STRA|nr:unnamed protein product [Phytophthora fragariaefolia]